MDKTSIEYHDHHKRCPGCGESLPTSSFYLDKTRPDGLRRLCKRCHNASRRTPLAEVRRKAARQEDPSINDNQPMSWPEWLAMVA